MAFFGTNIPFKRKDEKNKNEEDDENSITNIYTHALKHMNHT